MTLTVILHLLAAAIPYATLLPTRARGHVLLVLSILALYLLQPPLPIRFADFLLPTFSLLLAVAGWVWTRDLRLTIDDLRLREKRTRMDTDEHGSEAESNPSSVTSNQSSVTSHQLPVTSLQSLPSSYQSPVPTLQSLNLSISQSLSPDDRLTLLLSFGLVLALSLFRYIPAEYRLTPSRPPSPQVMLLVIGVLVISVLVRRFPNLPITNIPITNTPITPSPRTTVLILLLFLALKTEPIAAALATFFRSLTGQDITLAAATDLNWLGFSYLAFRLLHTLRDRQNGLLPDLSLREYLTYALFFPAFTAGPSDRAERFTPELRALPTLNGADAARWLDGLTRIGMGLCKKFIIADALAQGGHR